MLAEREKRLLRTVTGGGQAVGAEPYPGKKGNQGYVLTRLVTEWIQRGTEQGCADRLHILRPSHTLRRRGRGKHTRSPPRVSDVFRMQVGCGAETFSLQMQEPMSLQSMVPTNGRCERARAILEQLSNGRLPKSIADLLRGELGQLRLAGLQSGHLAGIRQGLIYSAGATLRSSAGLCPRISTRIAERNGKNATANNPAVKPPVASFR